MGTTRKMSQRYFFPAEYTSKTKLKTNQKTNPKPKPKIKLSLGLLRLSIVIGLRDCSSFEYVHSKMYIQG